MKRKPHSYESDLDEFEQGYDKHPVAATSFEKLEKATAFSRRARENVKRNEAGYVLREPGGDERVSKKQPKARGHVGVSRAYQRSADAIIESASDTALTHRAKRPHDAKEK